MKGHSTIWHGYPCTGIVRFAVYAYLLFVMVINLYLLVRIYFVRNSVLELTRPRYDGRGLGRNMRPVLLP